MKEQTRRDFIDLTLGTKDFIRTLSYRDILTAACLALLAAAMNEIIDYYSVNDWLKTNKDLLTGIFLITLMGFNHVFYRLEHKRSNNFIGRVLHDCMVLLLGVAISRLKLLISGDGFSVNVESLGSFLF